ncbi:HEAT repeat protein [Dictyocaulus viviparus]|uniref:HEAT repeat protein n=1 Tax=Dictyocaulus viviparus TaxID=29172 RepID=A0A0D8YB34_DICVI|nr:HEAT repeat protein [Dictyocaulus viviparus]
MAQLLLDILQKTISQNQEDQKRALEFLNEASARDFTTFVKELSFILRSEECQPFARQAAGLQLKNILYAKDEVTRAQHLNRWLALPVDIRSHVKLLVVQTLGTEPFRPSIAAQCVAAIACAELPSGLWPDVIDALRSSVTNPSSSASLKESSLETLGYICQDIDASVLEQQSNSILTAIVHGMRKEEPSTHVRLAATNALLNSLEFTKKNFGMEAERHIIMQVVCEATQCTETLVKVAALQCLVRIMSLYYQFMEQYMGSALFAISLQAMNSNVPEVALQGIEFWSNVCEEEITLNLEAEEAAENNRVPEQVSRHYAKGAVPHICPLLLEILTHQEEGDDDDDWTPSKAAGVCIMLMAQCVGDTILDSVMPFLKHFSNTNWKYKEAAIMAFGSILDGPDPAKLMTLVEQAMPALIDSMAEKNVTIRDTAAWTIGRVLEICPEIVNKDGILERLLPALSQGLHQEPRVAANVCWALVALVKTTYDMACGQGTDSTGQPETYALSPCFEPMISELIKTTDRTDGNQSNLRLAAFETLMELIKNSPKDCYHVVQSTTVLMLKKLEQLLNMEATTTSSSDKNQLMDLQSLLCATLQSVLRKMRPEDAVLVGEHVMNGLVQIMNRTSNNKGGGNVMEEALLAVSVLAETLNNGFIAYVDALKPHLMRALANHEEPQVCAAAVGLVTDMCRAIEVEIAPALDDIMNTLIHSLQSPKLDKDVKVTILGCFGDIALAIGEHFERYVHIVMSMLSDASSAAVVTNPQDYDQVDYVDKLRENCITAYTGILQGMRPAGSDSDPEKKNRAKESLSRFVEPMCEMIGKCCETHPVAPSDALVATVAGLIGDLVVLYGNQIAPVFSNDKVVNALLGRGRKSRTSKTKSVALWASKEMRKAMAYPIPAS